MIYVISDTFFGRSSKAKERGFSSCDDMQTAMISIWNKQVKSDDIVYHLGNFAWDIISAEATLIKLNGIINILPSMYDVAALETAEEIEEVNIIDKGIFVIESLDCVLSSWPLRDWPAKNEGSLHIHGGDKRFKANLKKESRFNANCDLWSLSPISIDSLKEITETFRKI